MVTAKPSGLRGEGVPDECATDVDSEILSTRSGSVSLNGHLPGCREDALVSAAVASADPGGDDDSGPAHLDPAGSAVPNVPVASKQAPRGVGTGVEPQERQAEPADKQTAIVAHATGPIQDSTTNPANSPEALATDPRMMSEASCDLDDVVEIDWAAALTEHAGWLRRVLYARLGEVEGVDECMQEIGLAAVRQAAPIRDPSKVNAWLYQLAVRQALLYRRKMGRKRNLLARYAARVEPTESDDGTLDPLQWLLDRERAVLVREALAQLKEDDRRILLYKYAEGWSYGQIADEVGISHSAVEARLHRARQRLRKTVEQLMMEPPSDPP